MSKRLYLSIFILLSIITLLLFWQKDAIFKLISKNPTATHGVAEPKDNIPAQTDQNTTPTPPEPTTSNKPKIKSGPKVKNKSEKTTIIENDISSEEEEENLQANDKKSVSQ